MLKLRLSETGILNAYNTKLDSMNYGLASEHHLIMIFKNCFESMVQFLKFSKHRSEHSIIKAMELDGTFIMAMEVALDSDEDGNKSWVTGLVFDENDLEITDKTKVYTTTDSMFIESFKACAQRFGIVYKDKDENGNPLSCEDIYTMSTLPLKLIKDWGIGYFENKPKENEFELEIEDVAIIEFSCDRNTNKVSMNGSLHQNLKQAIKSDGKTDACDEEVAEILAV